MAGSKVYATVVGRRGKKGRRVHPILRKKKKNRKIHLSSLPFSFTFIFF